MILVKPLNYFLTTLLYEASYRVVSILIGLVLWVALVLFVPDYIIVPTLGEGLVFVVALTISFLISHLLEFMIGLASFWFGEIRALQHAFDTLSVIFSGRLAPLTFFPLFFQHAAMLSPFTWLGFIPTEMYLRHLSPVATIQFFLVGFGWLALLGAATYFLWKRGIKRYEGIGI